MILSPFLLLMAASQWTYIPPLTSTIALLIASMLSQSCFNLTTSQAMQTDTTSLTLILLSIWVLPLMLKSSWPIVSHKSHPSMFKMISTTLTTVLVLSFSTNNILVFYMLFEISLLPIMIMIMNWGYQPERLKATMYMMIYTMVASLPFLGMITVPLKSVFFFTPPQHAALTSSLMSIAMMMAFLVKLPIYGLHLWLPKAHTEAPVAGSMILASIMLKLGSYGMLRIFSTFPQLINSVKNIMMCITLVGASTTAILCLRQHDLKEAVAYASVSHMSLMAAALMTKSHWGNTAVMLMNLGHGLTSSMLFSMVNMYYEGSHSRSMSLNKGLLILSPLTAVLMMAGLLSNGGAPPFMNLLSEIFMFIPLMKWSMFMALLLFIISFMSMVYSMFIFMNTSHGQPMKSAANYKSSLILSSSGMLHLILLTPSIFMSQYTLI